MTDISNCPFNPRFPYGMWNNTSTNFKLFPSLKNHSSETGCCAPAVADTPTNTLTVAYDATVTQCYGWGTIHFPGTLPFGNFTPTTISGSVPFIPEGVVSCGGAGFKVGSNSPTALQNWFSSISFVSDSYSVRTYNTASALFAGGSGFNGVWTWQEAQSGFTVAEENAYWSAAVGKTLNVYIDNPSPITPAVNYIVEQLGNKNIFTNTSHQMSKKELYKYLSNNSGNRFYR